jgi:hypothetical protein
VGAGATSAPEALIANSRSSGSGAPAAVFAGISGIRRAAAAPAADHDWGTEDDLRAQIR